MPTYGFIPGATVTGLVVTPACDLSNQKVETITYLPVVPVLTFFGMPAVLPEIMRELDGQLQVVGLGGLMKASSRFSLPSAEDCSVVADELNTIVTKTNASAKEKTAATRARAGMEVIECIRTAMQPTRETLTQLFGEKRFIEVATGLVKNSHRLDTHFLPSDAQNVEWSAVFQPSLVLFRYAFSAPVVLFDLAQDVPETAWGASLTGLVGTYPGVTAFASQRPLKRARVRERFIADLLTRYTGIHSRLGSPDFSAVSVAEMVQSIGAKE
jgi:hypothetical protein